MDKDEPISKLQSVVDRLEIHEVLMRYCRGVDRGDADLILSAFHPDATDEHAAPRPASEFAPSVAAVPIPQLMHFIGNVLVELEGDTAYVESYFFSFSPQERGGTTSTRTRAGRYLDRFERRDGVWKISYRLVVDEWARLDELRDVPEDVGDRWGVRGPDDAVFHMRERLA